VTVDHAMAELVKVGFNMMDYMRIGENGDPFVYLSAPTRDRAAGLLEFTSEDCCRDVRKLLIKLSPIPPLGRASASISACLKLWEAPATREEQPTDGARSARLQQFVHAPQPIYERAHYVKRKVWHLINEKQEALLGDGSHLTIGLGDGCGAPRRPVDQGHFTEDAALCQRFDYLAIHLYLDLAGADHIHLVAFVTLSENHLAGPKADGGRSRIGQKLITDRGYFHR
jgi:hypothetical protein